MLKEDKKCKKSIVLAVTNRDFSNIDKKDQYSSNIVDVIKRKYLKTHNFTKNKHANCRSRDKFF